MPKPFATRPVLFHSTSNNGKEKKKVSEQFSSKFSHRNLGCNFDNPEEKTFLIEAYTFSLNVTEHSRNFRFFDKKKTFFFKRVFWRSRMQFWKPCPKTLRQKAHNLSLKDRKRKNFRVNIFPEKNPMDTENTVLTTLPKDSSNQTKFFCSMSNTVQGINFPVTKHFFPKNLFGHVEPNIDKLSITSRWKAEHFWLNVHNRLKSHFFPGKIIFLRLIVRKLRGRLWHFCRKNYVTCRNFSLQGPRLTKKI